MQESGCRDQRRSSAEYRLRLLNPYFGLRLVSLVVVAFFLAVGLVPGLVGCLVGLVVGFFFDAATSFFAGGGGGAAALAAGFFLSSFAAALPLAAGGAGLGWRRCGRLGRLALRQPVLGLGVDFQEQLAGVGAVGIAADLDAELVQQRADLDALGLGDDALQAGHRARLELAVGDDADDVHRDQEPVVHGDRVSAERGLRDVGDDERRAAFELLQLLGRLADVLLLERFEVELVDALEHAVERLLESGGGFAADRPAAW